MIEKRIDTLRLKMQQSGIEGLLVTKPENRRYISGFTGTSGIVLITQEQNLLLTDFRYINQAKKEASSYEIIKYELPYWNTLNDIIKRLPIENLGFESEFVTYNQFLELSNKLSTVKLLPQKNMIECLRMIKDETEINLIKKAASIADDAFNHILKIIKPGIKEKELAIELEYFMILRGATGVSFTTIVASGERSSLPHGVATNKVIKNGDLVTIDFGCVYEGYCSDMTRTVVLGNPRNQQREIYEIVLDAQNLGLQAVRAGISANNIDAISRKHIESKGYGEYFGHGLGHGLGLTVHESPSLSSNDHTQLLSNMVITIEPGIYIPGWGGVRIEDLIVVLDNGCENLTRSPKELIII